MWHAFGRLYYFHTQLHKQTSIASTCQPNALEHIPHSHSLSLYLFASHPIQIVGVTLNLSRLFQSILLGKTIWIGLGGGIEKKLSVSSRLNEKTTFETSEKLQTSTIFQLIHAMDTKNRKATTNRQVDWIPLVNMRKNSPKSYAAD